MGKFSSLTLTEWQCFPRATFALEPLTLIGGAPGMGKSVLCESVAFIARAASGVNLTEALDGGACGPVIGGGAMWAARRTAWHMPARSFGVELEFMSPEPHGAGFYGLEVRAGDWGVFADGEMLVCEGRRPEAGKSGSGVARLLSGARGGESPTGEVDEAGVVKEWLHVALRGSGVYVPNPDSMRRPWPICALPVMRRDGGDLAGVAAGLPASKRDTWLATLNADLAAALPAVPRFALDVAENTLRAEAELRLVSEQSGARLPAFLISDVICAAAAVFAAVRLAPCGALIALDCAERFVPANPAEAEPFLEALRLAALEAHVTVVIALARNDIEAFAQASGARAMCHTLNMTACR